MSSRFTPAALSTAPAPSADADTLATLARRVQRLVPSHRDPERCHEEKSEIVHALRRLARTSQHATRPRS